MSYAKHTTDPPPFDAASATKTLPAAWSKFPEWKRWVEATSTQDGRGLKDVVEANAIGLDDLKVDVDNTKQALQQLAAQVAALQESPPFPG